MLEDMDWFAVAGRINQLSLVPFLGLLWTLWHIPSAPRRTVHGFTFYLVFIGVTIPVGMYCRQQLGTSLANVDWLHGPCEALLTTANLLIVLGLRDALKQQQPPPGGTPAHNSSTTTTITSSSSSSSSSSEDTRGPSSSDTDAGALPSTNSRRQQEGAASAPLASTPQRVWEQPIDGRQGDAGSRLPLQPTPHNLAIEGHKPPARQQLLHLRTHTHTAGPSGVSRSHHVVNSSSCSSRASSSRRVLMGVPRVHVVSRAAPCVTAAVAAAAQRGRRVFDLT